MLPSLEHLDLSFNPITSLPESINNLVKLQTLGVYHCANLTMLPELPQSLKRLYAKFCRSLKSITNLPNSSPAPDPWSYDILDSDLWYCGKLVDVEGLFNTLALRGFDIQLLKDTDLFNLKPNGGVEVYCASFFGRRRRCKGFYERGIFSIFVHESKIPDRFNYRSMGNTVFSFIVPSHLNIKILGLNACILYARQSDRSPEIARGHHRHSLELRNETKGLKWKLSMFNEVQWKEMNEDMLWLSHWIMRNNEFECGEEVCFEVEEQDAILTKDIGVRFVYEQQNKDKEDVLLSSEDAMIQRCRSPWNWSTVFVGGVRSGRETRVECIDNSETKVISTVVCATQYLLCSCEVINLDNESRMTP